MTRQMFDEHRDEIDRAVTLVTKDPKRRKLFQIATVYNRQSSELLAEVLLTHYGLVVAYAARTGGVMANISPGGGGLALHDRQLRDFRWIAPLTGVDGQTITTMSRGNVAYELALTELIDFIERGHRSRDHHDLTFRRNPAQQTGRNTG